MLIPADRLEAVVARVDEHERLAMWGPLIREHSRTFGELVDGVVQVRLVERDPYLRSSLGSWLLKLLENGQGKDDWEGALESFRSAFRSDDFLTNRAAETELVLLAMNGREFRPEDALTSGVQLRILDHSCSRVVLEYFSEHGKAKRVRHLAELRLRRLAKDADHEPKRG